MVIFVVENELQKLILHQEFYRFLDLFGKNLHQFVLFLINFHLFGPLFENSKNFIPRAFLRIYRFEGEFASLCTGIDGIEHQLPAGGDFCARFENL